MPLPPAVFIILFLLPVRSQAFIIEQALAVLLNKWEDRSNKTELK